MLLVKSLLFKICAKEAAFHISKTASENAHTLQKLSGNMENKTATCELY